MDTAQNPAGLIAPNASTGPSLTPGRIALLLRTGLGLVILFGGWNKLLQALNPERSAAFVETYLSAGGYVSVFFQDYLFAGLPGELLSPWAFLTALSTLELVSGLLLVAGVLVRPLALVWGLLFWTFVLALPVVTAAGYEITLPTHESPALLVLIRDVGLSGMFFVLFNIGSGDHSVDERIFGRAATRSEVRWDDLGLLLRLSVGLPFLVGGAFAGHGSHIQTFATPAPLLLLVGLLLVLNVGTRLAGTAAGVIVLWFMVVLFDPGRPLIADMNAFKREFAILAGAVVLAFRGGGGRFSLLGLRAGWKTFMRPGAVPEEPREGALDG